MFVDIRYNRFILACAARIIITIRIYYIRSLQKQEFHRPISQQNR